MQISNVLFHSGSDIKNRTAVCFIFFFEFTHCPLQGTPSSGETSGLISSLICSLTTELFTDTEWLTEEIEKGCIAEEEQKAESSLQSSIIANKIAVRVQWKNAADIWIRALWGCSWSGRLTWVYTSYLARLHTRRDVWNTSPPYPHRF